MIQLGEELKDKVTGFVGVAVAKTVWMYGCTRWTLQPPLNTDGKIPDSVTFDEAQLERVGPGIQLGITTI